MWPFAHVTDSREAIFRIFHRNGFRIASIGYWGTSFRTNLEEAEIKAASRDLQAAYVNYARQCDCKPLIVAESLGANVLFYTMRAHPETDYRFIAVSPVMRGLQHALLVFEESLTEQERTSEARRSYLYKNSNRGAVSYVGPRLINSFQHMKTFAGQEDSAFEDQFLADTCSRVVLGSEDHLNLEHQPSANSQILVLPGLGHKLDASLTSMEVIVEEAIGCQAAASPARNDFATFRPI